MSASAIAPGTYERLREIGGDAFVRKMIALFRETARQRGDEIASGASGGDLDAVRAAAHSLRSSAGNLGAIRLGELASAIEALAAAGDRAGVEDLSPAFRDELAAASEGLAALEARLDGTGAG